MNIDVKQEGGQNRSLWDAIFQASQSASLAVTGSKGEASVSDKFHDHADHVLVRQKS